MSDNLSRLAAVALGALASLALSMILANEARAAIIDPFEFRPDPVYRPSTEVGSVQESVTVDEATLESEDQGLFDDTMDSTEEDREDTDWCLWSALESMATNFEAVVVEGHKSVDEALEEALSGCLDSHFSGTDEASDTGWVAEALTLRDNVMVLESLGKTTEEANDIVYSGGTITLSNTEWEEWFSGDSQSVPAVPFS